ncbi:MAG: hemerythrin domain-containing protein [Saprospiraceae bacterium]|nr:hemerythrin domain-containing protein [Saprospiraceae bacterium]
MSHLDNNSDYLRRNVEKDTNGEAEFSPMDPPDAYHPPSLQAVPKEELAPLLQHLMDEHQTLTEALERFEQILIEIRKEGITRERNAALGGFYRVIDETVALHHLREERLLFPLLHDRLIDKGEHSTGAIRESAVDVMESDHIRTMQLASLTLNLMGLASRLPDPASQAVVIDLAVEQGLALSELMRLHIFREDNVVFPLAHSLITREEFAEMQEKSDKYFSAAH